MEGILIPLFFIAVVAFAYMQRLAKQRMLLQQQLQEGSVSVVVSNPMGAARPSGSTRQGGTAV